MVKPVDLNNQHILYCTAFLSRVLFAGLWAGYGNGDSGSAQIEPLARLVVGGREREDESVSGQSANLLLAIAKALRAD